MKSGSLSSHGLKVNQMKISAKCAQLDLEDACSTSPGERLVAPTKHRDRNGLASSLEFTYRLVSHPWDLSGTRSGATSENHPFDRCCIATPALHSLDECEVKSGQEVSAR